MIQETVWKLRTSIVVEFLGKALVVHQLKLRTMSVLYQRVLDIYGVDSTSHAFWGGGNTN